MAEEKKAPEKEKKENGRKPSALKRALQAEQRRLRNRSYRASLLTAIRKLEAQLSKPGAKLTEVYSIVDKGVKKGKIPLNRASRIKSRLHQRWKKAQLQPS